MLMNIYIDIDCQNAKWAKWTKWLKKSCFYHNEIVLRIWLIFCENLSQRVKCTKFVTVLHYVVYTAYYSIMEEGTTRE